MVLSKDQVKKLSARDKKRFLMLTNMLRDLDLYRKLLIYVRKQDTGNRDLDEAALITFVLSFDKILISKAYEIWEFLGSEKIGQEKPAFSASLASLWDEICTFFHENKNEELFQFVRNKFGFHFDWYPDLEPYIENAMNEIGDLEFWMGNDSSGNDVFDSSNSIMLIVLRNKMRELGFTGSDEELVGQLHKLPLHILHIMSNFCERYLTEIILRQSIFQEKLVFTVTVPLLSEVNVPLIVKNDLKESL